MSNTFGAILSFDDVEDWFEGLLQDWQETYLAELERRKGITPHSLPLIKSWNRFNDVQARWPENSLPAVVIAAPGLAGPPIKEGNGLYTADVIVSVAIVAMARDKAAAREVVKLYASAFRAAVVQHPDLGGHAETTIWLNEHYDTLVDPEDERTLNGAVLDFQVSVRGFAQTKIGPQDIPVNPYNDPGSLPIALTTDLQVDREPL